MRIYPYNICDKAYLTKNGKSEDKRRYEAKKDLKQKDV